MLLEYLIFPFLFTRCLSRRCYSCAGGNCSYKMTSSYPSIICPPGYDMCQSLCYNGTINVHRCTNIAHDCTSMRNTVISTNGSGFKTGYVVENEEGEVYTRRPDQRVQLKVSDCYLCNSDLCNFVYLCENLKNAMDYEDLSGTNNINHTQEAIQTQLKHLNDTEDIQRYDIQVRGEKQRHEIQAEGRGDKTRPCLVFLILGLVALAELSSVRCYSAFS
ncbi:hypothetical protein M8J76_012280 [Diaphorina citri]|nr:hypothetical protein M8J75_014105 [Diaphorina citri]KAI5745572.1 hypothetical protein M8J76_012280 [Diaphorina citri]